MTAAVISWLSAAYLYAVQLFSEEALLGRFGVLILLLGIVALYRAQKVAKNAEAWRDAAQAATARAEAERSSGEAWKGELSAHRDRATRLERDLQDQRTIVSEQLLHLAELRARTDLQPLQDASERRHSDLVALLTQVVASNEKIVAAVVRHDNGS